MAISSLVKKVSQLSLVSGVAAAAVIGVTDPTHAYTIFFGEDLNHSSHTPLWSLPNAQRAEANFLSGLTDTGIATFDSFAPRTASPLTLTFPGGKTATLNGNGSIYSITPGRTNGVGRYPISGSNYWEANADWGQFSVTFNQKVAAFGFYGIDIGDFGGQLVLTLVGSSNRQVTVPNRIGSYGSTDGSVLYFGIVANNPNEYFTSVLFNMSTGEGDFFGFDNMTFGNIQQPIPATVPIPEPSSILPDTNPPKVSIPEPAFGLGVMALGAIAALKLLLGKQQRR
jgi:hypothetical protein